MLYVLGSISKKSTLKHTLTQVATNVLALVQVDQHFMSQYGADVYFSRN